GERVEEGVAADGGSLVEELFRALFGLEQRFDLAAQLVVALTLEREPPGAGGGWQRQRRVEELLDPRPTFGRGHGGILVRAQGSRSRAIAVRRVRAAAMASRAAAALKPTSRQSKTRLGTTVCTSSSPNPPSDPMTMPPSSGWRRHHEPVPRRWAR